jgi:hypothetical protein
VKSSIFLLFIFLIFIIPSSLSAESGSVMINEIAWMGTPVQGVEEKQWWRYEWLELYNNTDTVEMLDGWNVELYREKELYFQIPLSGTVVPYGYFLVGASDKIPGVDVNYSSLGGKFLNTGQRVVLSNAAGAVIDEVDASSGWPGGDNKTKQTMERIVGSSPTTWQTSALAGGTPKAPNSEGFKIPEKSTKYFGDSNNISRNSAVQETEKDLLRSSSSQSFQSHVPIVNPITLLAGLLALGFSGVLLLVKRSLVLRQSSGQASRQERQRS